MTAVADPTNEAAGHAAGFALNTLSKQAFWIVVNRDGNCFGNCTATMCALASPFTPIRIFASKLAPFARLVFADVDAENDGLNGNALQSAA